MVTRRLAGRLLFEPDEVVAEPRTTVHRDGRRSSEWTLYRHAKWPLESAEVPTAASPPVRVCVGGWRSDVATWVRLLEVVDEDFARAIDDRG